eukprot:3168031-Prymnesium_polylepis.1
MRRVAEPAPAAVVGHDRIFGFGVAVRCVAPPVHLGKGCDLGAHTLAVRARKGCATRGSCVFSVWQLFVANLRACVLCTVDRGH